MKNLLKRLPALVFALVAVAAFAFNMPNSDVNQQLYGTTDNGSTWYDASNAVIGEDYLCNAAQTACLYTGMQAIPANEVSEPRGEFVPLTLTPVQ